MANDIYRIYVSQVFALAKTMVIRSEASAVVTNATMAARGIAVSDDKRTWRYYMNISGAYHSTNPPMRVTSVDTREEIDFTVENLKIHRATAAEYAYGTKRYKQLLEQYPRNETLILGILNPVDMTTAINAEDGDILWMDMSLVDENELNLKDLIQAEITAAFGNRINDYARIEELYEYGRHNIIYAALPMIIINARLDNCRTIFAHSFHIRCFLASHGRLDRYMDSMTKLQQLFFYRNLPYLNRNPGQKNIFEWLIKKVLEDRDFPIARYTMNHNLEEMPDSLYPGVEMTRSEITAAYAGIPDESYTVEEVLEKEMYLAESNSKDIDYRANRIQRKLSIAKVGTSQTKVLDSRVVDRSDSQVFSLANTLLTHWLFLSATNRYRAVVRVTNPRSGEEIVLSAKDAFVLFLYAYNRVNYLVLDKIPHLAAVHVRRIPKPALDKLLTKVPKYALDDKLIHQIYDAASPVDSYISIASFNEAMNEVYRTSMIQYRLAASQGNFRTRGYATALMEGMYHTVGVDMYDGTPYPAWLKERGLNEIEEFGQFEIEELASELLAVATGSDLNTTVSLSDIHRDMVSIMSQLSSYSVQFVREINTTPLKPIDIRFIKPGDNDGEEDGWSRIDLMKLKLLRSGAEEYGYRELDNKHLIVSNRISSEEENKQSFNVGLDFWSTGFTEHLSRVELPILRLKVPGIQPLIDLGEITEKDHSDIIVTPGDIPDIDLALVYPETDMDGLHLPAIVEVPLSQVFVNTNMDGLIPPE